MLFMLHYNVLCWKLSLLLLLLCSEEVWVVLEKNEGYNQTVTVREVWRERGQREDQTVNKKKILTSFLSCPATVVHRKLIQYQSLPQEPVWRRSAGFGSSPRLLSARYSWRSWDSREGNPVTLWCRSVLGPHHRKIQLEEKDEGKYY